MVSKVSNESDYKSMLASEKMAVAHFWAGMYIVYKSLSKNVYNILLNIDELSIAENKDTFKFYC